MSTLHGNVYWPAICRTLSAERASFKPFENASCFCFGSSEIASITPLLESLFDSFYQDVSKMLLFAQAAGHLGSGNLCAWPKDSVKKTILKTVAAYTKLFSKPKVEEEHKGPMHPSLSASLETLKKAHEIAKKFIDGHTPVESEPHICFTIAPGALEEWKAKTTVSLWHFAYTYLGLQSENQRVSFSDDDIEAFHLAKKPENAAAEKLSCVAFALLKTREERAQKLIFESPKEQAQVIREIPSLLKKWSYRVVRDPDAGDLVLYLKGSEPVHMGFFLESGKVLSKMGVLNPFSYEHGLSQVPSDYGSRVVFFRKTHYY